MTAKQWVRVATSALFLYVMARLSGWKPVI